MEKNFTGFKMNGFIMIFIIILMLSYTIYSTSIIHASDFFLMILQIALISVLTRGFVVIEPNDMRVMVFFGKYQGTLRDNGFFWINPFYSKSKLTYRARNLDVQPIKVNDKTGNPVMIGLVLVWRVKDSYKAIFEIDSSDALSTATAINNSSGTVIYSSKLKRRMASFQKFVSIQSDSALRNIASEFAYDSDVNKVTLRSGGDKVTSRLEEELNLRLDIAGIEVIEARINYLAYAPEIAAIMLRRQQATAIISAREKIVEGAVSMVQMALNKLSEDNIIDLDDDKKSAMVSNLLVVLCSDGQAQPVINTGTLHQ